MELFSLDTSLDEEAIKDHIENVEKKTNERI
jgi:hypothetical protein